MRATTCLRYCMTYLLLLCIISFSNIPCYKCSQFCIRFLLNVRKASASMRKKLTHINSTILFLLFILCMALIEQRSKPMREYACITDGGLMGRFFHWLLEHELFDYFGIHSLVATAKTWEKQEWLEQVSNKLYNVQYMYQLVSLFSLRMLKARAFVHECECTRVCLYCKCVKAEG